MKVIITSLIALLISGAPVQVWAQSQSEEVTVLKVVQKFFDALQKQDTAAFQKMFLTEARNFSVRRRGDSTAIRSQESGDFRFNPSQIIIECMRPARTVVKIHGNIAMVWAPYDLWINDTFSHCGVDVFTLIKDSSEWKIASLSYTIEREGCN